MVMSDYLIEICLRNELACQARDDWQFNDMVNILYDNWDTINHYHKHRIDKDKLLTNPGGSHISIPTQVRAVACAIARKLPSGPMSGRDLGFVNDYVMALAKDDPEWKNKSST
jgi:hypothetical protein